MLKLHECVHISLVLVIPYHTCTVSGAALLQTWASHNHMKAPILLNDNGSVGVWIWLCCIYLTAPYLFSFHIESRQVSKQDSCFLVMNWLRFCGHGLRVACACYSRTCEHRQPNKKWRKQNIRATQLNSLFHTPGNYWNYYWSAHLYAARCTFQIFLACVALTIHTIPANLLAAQFAQVGFYLGHIYSYWPLKTSSTLAQTNDAFNIILSLSLIDILIFDIRELVSVTATRLLEVQEHH